MSSILILLENYLDKDLEIMRASGPYGEGIKSPDWASDGSVEDVIVKVSANEKLNRYRYH